MTKLLKTIFIDPLLELIMEYVAEDFPENYDTKEKYYDIQPIENREIVDKSIVVAFPSNQNGELYVVFRGTSTSLAHSVIPYTIPFKVPLFAHLPMMGELPIPPKTLPAPPLQSFPSALIHPPLSSYASHPPPVVDQNDIASPPPRLLAFNLDAESRDTPIAINTIGYERDDDLYYMENNRLYILSSTTFQDEECDHDRSSDFADAQTVIECISKTRLRRPDSIMGGSITSSTPTPLTGRDCQAAMFGHKMTVTICPSETIIFSGHVSSLEDAQRLKPRHGHDMLASSSKSGELVISYVYEDKFYRRYGINSAETMLWKLNMRDHALIKGDLKQYVSEMDKHSETKHDHSKSTAIPPIDPREICNYVCGCTPDHPCIHVLHNVCPLCARLRVSGDVETPLICTCGLWDRIWDDYDCEDISPYSSYFPPGCPNDMLFRYLHLIQSPRPDNIMSPSTSLPGELSSYAINYGYDKNDCIRPLFMHPIMSQPIRPHGCVSVIRNYRYNYVYVVISLPPHGSDRNIRVKIPAHDLIYYLDAGTCLFIIFPTYHLKLDYEYIINNSGLINEGI